jgi:hypothetical protein
VIAGSPLIGAHSDDIWADTDYAADAIAKTQADHVA